MGVWNVTVALKCKCYNVTTLNIFISSVLSAATDIVESNNTQTSYAVSWNNASGNLEGYIVECVCIEDNLVCNSSTSSMIQAPQTVHTCINLTPGSRYRTRVRTVRDTWEDHIEVSRRTAKTCKLTLILPIYIIYQGRYVKYFKLYFDCI